MKTVSFFDLEVDGKNKIFDIGCIRWDGATFHENSVPKFIEFIKNTDFIAGHNVLNHDLKFIRESLRDQHFGVSKTIDTLYLSPLLFPARPYHNLVKDDKLQVEELSNPLNDSIKAKTLFDDEVGAFKKLDENLKRIFFNLLESKEQFSCFFKCLDYAAPLTSEDLEKLIVSFFDKKICGHAPLSTLIKQAPIELAYALALIDKNDKYSIPPRWLVFNFPDIDRVLFLLRGRPCVTGCEYCSEVLNPFSALKRYFHFDQFRTYGNQPLQENAVRAAIQNESLLAIFPTGGGKSLTFQLPALISGETTKGLTVIISPLQSLMKDQVDNLEKNRITDAVTINGLLDPIERSEAIERIQDGRAHILYIAPELLRSATIESLLLGRKISRFVIDEAHCFSSWGQDFRVDYLYIGKFIKNLQEKKNLSDNIPVSCFTATARPKVIGDICNYFKEQLGIELKVFRTNASRTNLQYRVFTKNGEDEKYAEVRRLLEAKHCPTIIYVSRTKRADQLAERLTSDGFEARAFHGKMDKDEKSANQDAFIKGEVDIMVATSAFGMGVDKSDVGMVIHYDISDSLENYIQEAGRAGRDSSMVADCYILFDEADLDRHFVLLNQTKLDAKEINQIWSAIKELTKKRDKISNSALEIARRAGWDDNISDIETKVTTAIAALEERGYVKRRQNSPRIYANSILTKTAQEAIRRINNSEKFDETQKENATRIIKKLFSSKSKRLATDEDAESRIDYISDHLGIRKEEVIQIVQLLREENILADAKDLTAFIKKGQNSNRSLAILNKYKQLEEFFLNSLEEHSKTYNLKEFNENAVESGCESSPAMLNTLMNFWAIKSWIKRHNHEHSRNHVYILLRESKALLKEKMTMRHFLANAVVEYLYKKSQSENAVEKDEVLVEFSVLELMEEVKRVAGFFELKVTNKDIEDTLFYLTRIDAIKIEGGFLVVYTRLTIQRLEMNSKVKFKQEDYQDLAQFYKTRTQQIHIVGEYARKMIENYNEALQFVDDYFTLNYNTFLSKYFPGSRQDEIKRSLTRSSFQKLFGALSPDQLKIINDRSNQYIVVAAGPGSGKTRVLVHKLASLLLTEDVKQEQLLMLTFSRAAATEFKKRLIGLIGNAAHYVEIRTFHSYCFDLIGKVGNVSEANTVLKQAVDKIRNGEIELSRITKSVLVVDEAQDVSADEFELVKVLMDKNPDMRVLLVGDDDQNIYEFRGSSSKYMISLIKERSAKTYELIENYRSKANLVAFANQWAVRMSGRLKKTPTAPHDKSDGYVRIIEHQSGNLTSAVVQSIRETDLIGSTCILTKTNDEAVEIAGLLNRERIFAKLIQSNNGFELFNLAELRYFSSLVAVDSDAPTIDDEEWEKAKQELNRAFANSDKLKLCNDIISDFEKINVYKKYKSDWKTFLSESKLEDFINIDSETIYVSTIHKAKGKEFDNVFLVLEGFDSYNEECKRQFYVAVTRAKNNLVIHYNGSYLRNIIVNNMSYENDNFVYSSPQSISCLLTHRDVNLGYFEWIQGRVNGLVSSEGLAVVAEGLSSSKGLVVKFSNGFSNRINQLNQKGYKMTGARVNFIVYWFSKETKKELKVVLPEVEFTR